MFIKVQEAKVNTILGTEPLQEKTRILVKNLTKETIGNETAQALIRIFDTKYTIIKVFWILCLLGCVSLCGYLVAETFLTYLSNSVYTTTTIVHEVPTLFPKVTICNSMFGTTEYAYELVREINDRVSPNISIFNKNQISKLAYNDAFSLFWKVINLFQTRINSATFSNIERQKLVHSFDDVLLLCLFNGQPCTINDFIWKWDPLYGNCYSFNTGFNSSGSRINYKESLLPGAVFGLQLTVYVGYNDKLNLFNNGYFSWIPFSHSYGLNVLIENNTYLSYDKQSSIALNGGTINFMSLHRRFSSKLTKPYSNCDIDNTNPGHYDSPFYDLIVNSPYQYSQQLCFTQCIQQQVIQLCNCSIPIYLSLYNVSCQNEAEALCAVWSPYNGKLSASVFNCIPKCPLECNTSEITFELTTQTFSGFGYALVVNQTPSFLSDFNSAPITETEASNKFVQLILYYDSLTFTSSTDTPSMDIVAFLGNIGGTLGLFLGISLLSVCETLHVIIESGFLLKYRLQNKNKTSRIP
jgi:hypothetical protein